MIHGLLTNAASKKADKITGAGSCSDKSDNTNADYKLQYLKLIKSFEEFRRLTRFKN